MTPKEYLSQIMRLDGRIRRRMEQKEELESLCGLSGSSLGERVQTSAKAEASFVRMVEKCEAMAEEINRLIDRYVDTKNNIIGQIEAMPDELYARVLCKRYVEAKRLEQIALEMNYSYIHVRRLHGMALQAFGRQFSDSLRKDDTQ